MIEMVREFQREKNELKRKLEATEEELAHAKRYKECFETERAQWLTEVNALREEANRLWNINANYRRALLQVNWQPPPIYHNGLPPEEIPPLEFGNERLKMRHRALHEYIQYLHGDNQAMENLLRQAFGLNNDLSLAQYILRLRNAVINSPPGTVTVPTVPAAAGLPAANVNSDTAMTTPQKSIIDAQNSNTVSPSSISDCLSPETSNASSSNLLQDATSAQEETDDDDDDQDDNEEHQAQQQDLRLTTVAEV